MARNMTRRDFLRVVGAGTGAAALAACGNTTPSAAGEPTEAVQPAVDTAAATTVPAVDTAAATAAPAVTTTAAGEAPATSSGLTLTYWAGLNVNVAATKQSFSEMTCYMELEKATGVKLEFQHPPTGGTQAEEQFNLMIASATYPDVIEWNWLGFPGGPKKALRDGVIIRLNELIDEHAPNLKKVLTENPEWRKQIITDEGDIYCFPFLRGDPTLLTFTGPAIRQDWLDKAGLKPPTTIEEWHTTLQGFKGKDLNGNGQEDESPFTPWMDSGVLTGFINSNAFIGAWGITPGFYQDNGVVKYGPSQPEFKEFLGTMLAWSQEGLIDPDSFSLDQGAYDAKVTGSQLGAYILRVGGGIGKFMSLMKDQDPKFKIVGVPYPTLKAGDKPILGQRDNIYPGGASAAITSANTHQVETVKVLDYAYGPEGHMLFNFGVEGLTYTLVDGYPTYTDLIMKNPDNLPLSQSMAQHFRSNFAGPFVQDKRYFEQYSQLPEQKDAYTIWSQPSNERLMPPITPTEEETRKFARTMTEVTTRYEEVFAKVLSGGQPLETWDGFVQELNQLGIEEALQVQQAALDRYNKRP